MSTAPDVSTYYLIHRAMRVTSTQLRDALATMRQEDRPRAAALRDWIAGFVGELRAHHHVEDDIFLPALAERVPGYAHEEQVVVDHARLDEIIDSLTAAAHRLAGTGHWEASRAEGEELASELRDLLYAHLAIEDEDIVPLFEQHFTAAEYERLEKQATKFGSFTQMVFTLGWLGAAIDRADRDRLLSTAPKPLSLLWKLTHRRYERLAARALGPMFAAVA